MSHCKTVPTISENENYTLFQLSKLIPFDNVKDEKEWNKFSTKYKSLLHPDKHDDRKDEWEKAFQDFTDVMEKIQELSTLSQSYENPKLGARLRSMLNYLCSHPTNSQLYATFYVEKNIPGKTMLLIQSLKDKQLKVDDIFLEAAKVIQTPEEIMELRDLKSRLTLEDLNKFLNPDADSIYLDLARLLGLVAAGWLLKKTYGFLRYRRQNVVLHTATKSGKIMLMNRKIHDKALQTLSDVLNLPVDQMYIEERPTSETVSFPVPRNPLTKKVTISERLMNELSDRLEANGIQHLAELQDDGTINIYLKK